MLTPTDDKAFNFYLYRNKKKVSDYGENFMFINGISGVLQ
jgi:hypothetical protein